jgi:hypothetical protein
MTATFTAEGDDLYLEQYDHKHKVVKAYESMTGWYWFFVERAEDIYYCPATDEEYGYSYPEGEGTRRGNKPRPPRHEDDTLVDTVWFAYVQGFEDEWGYTSERELRSTPLVWEIAKQDIPHSGRRESYREMVR